MHITSLESYEKQFKTTEWVYNRIIKSIRKKQGLSLIRIGDGETRTLAHNDLITMEEIPHWLRYAGVNLPDVTVKRRLIMSINRADIIGLPVEDNYYFKPLMIKSIKKYNLRLATICSNRINYHLFRQGYLLKLIRFKKIIIVGRKARDSLSYFSKYAQVTAVYDLPDIDYIDIVYEKIKDNLDFELALVCAGIPAVILCPRLAFLNKVAIDLGHVIDSIVTPDEDLFKLMENWLQKNKSKPQNRSEKNDWTDQYYSTNL